MRRHPLRTALLILAAAAAAWLVWPRPRAAVATLARAGLSAPRRIAPHAPAAPRAGDELPSPEPASFIADIVVSPAAVCPGEAFTVTVEAHDPEGVDEGLYTVVAGGFFGSPVVLTAVSQPGDHELPVTVFSKRGPGLIDSRRASVTVRDDCGPDVQRLEVVQRAIGRHVVGFAVSRRGGDGTDAVRSYRWDFGDGATLSTDTPFAEHDYARTRPRRGIQRNLIATVEAMTASGRRIEGTTAVAFFSLYEKNRLEAGVLSPEVQVEAVEAIDDGYAVTATVSNVEDVALSLADVEAQAIPCDPDAEPTSAERPAAAVFGTGAVPPGESTLHATLPSGSVPPGTCRVLLTARGGAPSGEAVQLQLAAVLQDPGPARVLEEDSGDPDEQLLLRRIHDARDLLARNGPADIVTQEEIDWLVEQGRIE